MNFADFGLRDDVMEGIEAMGYDTPTPIQQQGIPIIKEGKDLIGCAQTGTGKTAAFLIPVINRISGNPGNKIKCLIIVPTRELAVQIDQQLDGFGYFCPMSSLPVYGGGEGDVFSVQKQAIQKGADILIATPGRLMAHMNLGYVDFSNLEVLILDEADRMMDMGFIDDITKIIKDLPVERQTLLFSATMDPKIRQLTNAILRQPEQINLAIAKPAAGVTQTAFMVYNPNKNKLLLRLLKEKQVQNMIIFAARKDGVDEINRALRKGGVQSKAIHSGREQHEREEIMRLFKAGKFPVLVATDILSRGIDIDGLSHVLNYDIPNDAADYVHRVGRTARADKKGEAISFVNPEDQLKVQSIEKLIEREIPKMDTPEDIGESPKYSPRSQRGGKSNFRKGKKKGKRFYSKNKRR